MSGRGLNKAVWNKQILTESNDTVIVENNYYFPSDSLNMQFLKTSNMHTRCYWKGETIY